MDWSKIKTIFIISFLILDFFLLNEFLKMKSVHEMEVSNETGASIEKRLMADKIEFVTLPKKYVKDYYLKAKPKMFIEEDIKKTILSNQQIKIVNGTVIESTLNEPMKLPDELGKSELNAFINKHILFGEKYYFGNKNKERKTITYYQHINNKPLFENKNGALIFYLNDKNEITAYKQTYLENIQELSENEKIIQPLKAIETLYSNGKIKPNSKITEIELGYYTLVPLSDKTQVLNPAWRFVINDNDVLYVSAFEGVIVDLDQKEENVVE